MAPSSASVSVGDDDVDLTDEIEAQVNEWSTNSSECFTVQLLRGEDHSTTAQFHPEFTYAMFGDEEAIFGYQDLNILLNFRADDMQPKLSISYSKSFPPQGEVRPTDIKEALQDFLPASAFEAMQVDRKSDFRPPGKKIHEYRRDGKSYEIWCASLADPAARRILENMQILVPMFIDGGSILELEQAWTTQRWKIFLVYEVDSDTISYSLAGYGTSYRMFTFPDRQKTIQFDDFSPTSQSIEYFLPLPTAKTNELSNSPDIESPLDLPSRERLSQFLMLPNYHGAGHGQELYNTMYRHLTAPDRVRELTIEDPNERFDDLRDFCDLLYLRANSPEFAALRINTEIPADKMSLTTNVPNDLIVSSGIRKQIMKDTKIMPRQFDRLVEMHTLSFIPPINRSRSRITRKAKTTNPDDKAYYFWRLYVKQRLYIFNKDQLSQIEAFERIEKLESALDSVLEAYSEMIERVETREKAIVNGEMDSSSPAVNSSFTKRKRAVLPNDSDDEDEEEDAGAKEHTTPTTNGQKKARVS